MASSMRGGYSSNCLPIDKNGRDSDDFKFLGMCLDDK